MRLSLSLLAAFCCSSVGHAAPREAPARPAEAAGAPSSPVAPLAVPIAPQAGAAAADPWAPVAAAAQDLGADAAQASKAQRLIALLDKLSPEQRQSLYARLSAPDRGILERRDRDGARLRVDPAQVEASPAFKQAVRDLADLGAAFPTVFAAADADNTIRRVILPIIRQREVESKLPDLLETQPLAARLQRTIDNSVINLIEQAEMEYEGRRFKRTRWQFFWYKVGRFFFPSYRKVVDIIGHAQQYERQLSRIRGIDKLIVKVVSEAAAVGLTDEEVRRLVLLAVKAPDEIKIVEKELKPELGEGFSIGQEAEIGSFDLNKGANAARRTDWERQLEKFDAANLAKLAELDELLDAAHERKDRHKRPLQEFETVELEIEVEAYLHRIALYRGRYLGVTGETSHEHYRVEDRHTRQVYDGQDSQGRAKYRTETYYTDRTVHPSFENILSGSYDTGDRFVSGLDSVKAAVAKVAARERGPRELVAATEDLIHEIFEAKDRKQYVAKSEKMLAKIDAAIVAQEEYARSPQERVLAQYGRDDYGNFQRRNAALLERLKNVELLLTHADELIARGQELTPPFDLFDFTQWLGRLRRIRNANYIRKTAAIGAAGAFALAYYNVPEFQAAVDPYFAAVNDWFWSAYYSVTGQPVPPKPRYYDGWR